MIRRRYPIVLLFCPALFVHAAFAASAIRLPAQSAPKALLDRSARSRTATRVFSMLIRSMYRPGSIPVKILKAASSLSSPMAEYDRPNSRCPTYSQ